MLLSPKSVGNLPAERQYPGISSHAGVTRARGAAVGLILPGPRLAGDAQARSVTTVTMARRAAI